MLFLLLGSTSCKQFFDYLDEKEPRPLGIRDFAARLKKPLT
jgi:hypothetical protein